MNNRPSPETQELQDALSYLSDVMLTKQNLKMLQIALVRKGKEKTIFTNMFARIKGTKVEVDGVSYYVSAHAAKIISELDQYRKSSPKDPDAVIKKLHKITGNWLIQNSTKNKFTHAKAAAKKIFESENSPPQHRLYAGMHLLTSQLSHKTNSVSAAFKEFFSHAKNLVRASSIKKPVLHKNIKLEDLNYRPHDLARSTLNPNKIQRTLKFRVNGRVETFHVYKGNPIGRGSFGIVALAQNAKTHEWIALKLMKNTDESHVKQEVKNLANTDDLIFHHLDKNTGEACIGMKLHPGADLESMLSSKRLSESQKLLLAKRIFKAAADVHNAKPNMLSRVAGVFRKHPAKRMVHRDFKPGNFMVDSGLRVRAIDFGLSSEVESDPNFKANIRGFRDETVGTAAYLSPEFLDKGFVGDYDEKSDVYGLGIVLIELMGLQIEIAPFRGHIRFALNEELAAHADPELVTLIRAMTNTKPHLRPKVNDAYRTLNQICSRLNHQSDTPQGLVIGAVSLQDFIAVYNQNDPVKLQDFIDQYLTNGVNSIAFYSHEINVPQDMLVRAERAFRDAGFLHFAPDVYTNVTREDAFVSMQRYYCATFGSLKAEINYFDEGNFKSFKPEITQTRVLTQ